MQITRSGVGKSPSRGDSLVAIKCHPHSASPSGAAFSFDCRPVKYSPRRVVLGCGKRCSGDLTRAWVNLAHGSGQAVEKRFGRPSKGFSSTFFLIKKWTKNQASGKMAKNAVDGLNPAKLAGRACVNEGRTGSNPRRLLHGHRRHFLNAIFPRAFPSPRGGKRGLWQGVFHLT